MSEYGRYIDLFNVKKKILCVSYKKKEVLWKGLPLSSNSWAMKP